MDGGLFYVMANDLQDNGFRLPIITSFNQDNIPFVYPPIGLYITSALSLIFPLLQVIRFLPLFYSFLMILAFFVLANRIFGDYFKAAFATVSFSLMPSSANILIQGGGVTRALGYLCMLLTLYFAITMFESSKKKYMIWTSIFGAAVILSHPSASFITVLYAILFFLYYGRSAINFKKSVFVIMLIITLTAPWWGINLKRHGIDVFTNGFGSGWFTFNWISPYIRLNTTRELFMSLIMVFSVIGIIYQISRKQWFLTLWFLFSLVSQRDGFVYASVPVALLCAVGFIDVIQKGFLGNLNGSGQSLDDKYKKIMNDNGTRLILSFFLIYNLVNAMSASFQFVDLKVSKQENLAMEWVEQNTPLGSRFLVLAFGDSLNSPIQEWFPAISGRRNVLTVQGYEWVGPDEVTNRIQVHKATQVCLTETIECIENVAKKFKLNFDYILVHSGYIGEESYKKQELHFGGWMVSDLQNRSSYNKIYQTDLITIYERLIDEW
jgi:hypothetical protein